LEVERADRPRRHRARAPAWIAKEQLRTLLATARRGALRSDVAHRLFRFYTWCADADIPELTRLATTVQAWWPQIEAFLHTPGNQRRHRGHESLDQRRRPRGVRVPQPRQT
jgi:transposase